MFSPLSVLFETGVRGRQRSEMRWSRIAVSMPLPVPPKDQLPRSSGRLSPGSQHVLELARERLGVAVGGRGG